MSFTKFPTEVLCNILSNVDSDRDLVRLSFVSRSLYWALKKERTNIWFQRYARFFDFDSTQPRAKVIPMATWSQAYMDLRNVQVKSPLICCEPHRVNPSYKWIRMLISSSFHGVKPGQKSKNMGILETIVDQRRICEDVFAPNQDSAMVYKMTQIMFFHQMIDLRTRRSLYGLPESQQVAYGHSNRFPIFEDQDGGIIHIDNVLHILNLFKCHFVAGSTGDAIEQQFSHLPWDLRPRAWDRPLMTEAEPLGRRWKGAECFLGGDRETLAVRYGNNRNEVVEDEFPPELMMDSFSDLTMSFDQDHQPVGIWPSPLETVVRPFPDYHSIEGDQPVSHTNLPFVGSFKDTYNSLVCGTTTNLPLQHGIRGWQRVSFIRYTNPFLGRTSNAAIAGVMEIARNPEAVAGANIKLEYLARLDADENSDTESIEDIFWDNDEEFDHAPNDIFDSDPPCSHQMWAGARPPVTEVGDLVRSSDSRSMLQRNVEDVGRGQAQQGRHDNRYWETKNRAEEILEASTYRYRKPDLAADVILSPQAGTWIYEGVVLPGGKVMVGKWRGIEERDMLLDADECANHDLDREQMRTGPFVYWCVDGSVGESVKTD